MVTKENFLFIAKELAIKHAQLWSGGQCAQCMAVSKGVLLVTPGRERNLTVVFTKSVIR